MHSELLERPSQWVRRNASARLSCVWAAHMRGVLPVWGGDTYINIYVYMYSVVHK